MSPKVPKALSTGACRRHFPTSAAGTILPPNKQKRRKKDRKTKKGAEGTILPHLISKIEEKKLEK